MYFVTVAKRDEQDLRLLERIFWKLCMISSGLPCLGCSSCFFTWFSGLEHPGRTELDTCKPGVEHGNLNVCSWGPLGGRHCQLCCGVLQGTHSMASEILMLGAWDGLSVNVLASHMFSVCCGELGDTKAELLNFTLPCSGDYVWVRKVRIVCILSLGCWFEDIVFL